ncbi:MAG: nuclear transport factor 2 family protein [Parasphingorhabdus sp.]|uniref:YybH family protein n=1 Tax=Parasphingorhabdus sp. TaxID=2709688 RepID=UPI003266A9CA
MRRFDKLCGKSKRLVAFFATLALAACSPANDDPETSAEAAFADYVAALNNGDVEVAASIYDDADGFHWIERGAVQYASAAEAANSLKASLRSGGKAKMRTDNVHVAEMGTDSALVSAHFEYTMFDDADKALFSFDGWMTVGMVRRKNGWKIAGGQTGPGAAEQE